MQHCAPLSIFIAKESALQHLTDRNADRPGDDPIFALNQEANERRGRGERVINATVGALLEDDGSLALMPTVIESLHAVSPSTAAGYAPIVGNGAFLQAVIRDLFGESQQAAQAVAVATPGGTGALRTAMSLFLDRGHSVLTTSFYWAPYATIADEQERAVRTFPMFTTEQQLDTNALADAMRTTAQAQGRVLLFLNDPCHNPTGYSMQEHEWNAVADHVIAQSATCPVTVLIDLAYVAFASDPKAWLRAAERMSASALVLVAWTASKSFALYGGRVGALVALTANDGERNAIARAFAYASRGSWSNCNALGQAAIAHCVKDAATRAKVDQERLRLCELLAQRVQAFNEHASKTSLRYPPYRGGFFVTVFCSDAPSAAARLRARGVFVVPQKQALRVALCGVPARDVPSLVDHLQACVENG